jgi:hypothetical protein
MEALRLKYKRVNQMCTEESCRDVFRRLQLTAGERAAVRSLLRLIAHYDDCGAGFNSAAGGKA